jgi:hypothetical protein
LGKLLVGDAVKFTGSIWLGKKGVVKSIHRRHENSVYDIVTVEVDESRHLIVFAYVLKKITSFSIEELLGERV